MAPGRRRTKKRTRMDAAVDHMAPMGFTNAAIQRKVNELLEVYCGDECGEEGWVFIEEGSYKLLVDALLEELEEDGGTSQSQPQPPPPLLMDEDRDAGDMLESFGTSDRVTCSQTRQQYTMHACADGGSHQEDSAAISMDVLPQPEKAQTRKPCYGWWGEDTEVVHLN